MLLVSLSGREMNDQPRTQALHSALANSEFAMGKPWGKGMGTNLVPRACTGVSQALAISMDCMGTNGDEIVNCDRTCKFLLTIKV